MRLALTICPQEYTVDVRNDFVVRCRPTAVDNNLFRTRLARFVENLPKRFNACDTHDSGQPVHLATPSFLLATPQMGALDTR